MSQLDSPPASARLPRDPQIDGLRGLSVLMVILLHAFLFVPVGVLPREMWGSYMEAIPTILLPILGFDRAVDIFFLISAYILARPLFVQVERRTVSYPRFLLVRLFRIYPVYLLLLLLAYLAQTGSPFALDNLWQLAQNVLFVDNFFHSSLIKVSWSLAVEMQFYLAMPALVLFAFAAPRPLWVLAAFFVVSLVARSVSLAYFPEVSVPATLEQIARSDGIAFFYYNTIPRIHTLFLGVLWGYAAHRGWVQGWIASLARRRFVPALVAGLAVFVIWVVLHFPFATEGHFFWRWALSSAGTAEAVSFLGFSLHRTVFCLALLAGLFALTAAQGQAWGRLLLRALTSRLLAFYSRLAFSMYLSHLLFLAVSAALVFWTVDFSSVAQVTYLQVFAVALLTMVLTPLIAWPLYRCVELPGINLGRRLAKRFT